MAQAMPLDNMNQKDWVWMPHPAHFCLADRCRFHLATYVNGYIVSTVGELVPDDVWRDVIVESRGIKISDAKGDALEREYMEKVGYQPLGYSEDGEGIYETMVFKAQARGTEDCCPYRIIVSEEQEMARYAKAGEARLGHLALCEKYSECNRDGFMSIKHCHFINDVADKIESLNKPVSKNEK